MKKKELSHHFAQLKNISLTSLDPKKIISQFCVTKKIGATKNTKSDFPQARKMQKVCATPKNKSLGITRTKSLARFCSIKKFRGNFERVKMFGGDVARPIKRYVIFFPFSWGKMCNITSWAC